MTVQERADRLRAFVRLRRIAGETCRMPSLGPDCACALCDVDALILEVVAARALADSASRGAVALLNDEKLGDQYVHFLTCNASRNEPVGCQMCSCGIGRRIRALRHVREAVEGLPAWLRRLADAIDRIDGLDSPLAQQRCGAKVYADAIEKAVGDSVRAGAEP